MSRGAKMQCSPSTAIVRTSKPGVTDQTEWPCRWVTPETSSSARISMLGLDIFAMRFTCQALGAFFYSKG
jgi:hypothetical protein